jgi:hypothetical protein
MSQYFDDKELFLSPKVTEQGNHMVMSNVNKTTKTKYVNIDTRFHEDFSLLNSASFIYNFPQRITDVKSIMVRNLELPITYYPFSVNKGNTFMKITKVNSSNSTIVYSKTVIIPDNNYTLDSLKSTINNVLTSIPDISFNISNGYSIFTSSDYNTYHYTIQFAVDSTGIFDKYQLKSKLGWSLGFREPEYTLDSTNNAITSKGPIDLINSRYLFLIMDEFKQSPNSFISPLHYSLINKNILARIVLDVSHFPYGSVLPANIFNGLLLSDMRTYPGKTDIQKLQIQLVDEWGKIVDLNNMDFSFCLEIQYE